MQLVVDGLGERVVGQVALPVLGRAAVVDEGEPRRDEAGTASTAGEGRGRVSVLNPGHSEVASEPTLAPWGAETEEDSS